MSMALMYCIYTCVQPFLGVIKGSVCQCPSNFQSDFGFSVYFIFMLFERHCFRLINNRTHTLVKSTYYTDAITHEVFTFTLTREDSGSSEAPRDEQRTVCVNNRQHGNKFSAPSHTRPIPPKIWSLIRDLINIDAPDQHTRSPHPKNSRTL